MDKDKHLSLSIQEVEDEASCRWQEMEWEDWEWWDNFDNEEFLEYGLKRVTDDYGEAGLAWACFMLHRIKWEEWYA